MSRQAKGWIAIFVVSFVATLFDGAWTVLPWAFLAGWYVNSYNMAADERDELKARLRDYRLHQWIRRHE